MKRATPNGTYSAMVSGELWVHACVFDGATDGQCTPTRHRSQHPQPKPYIPPTPTPTPPPTPTPTPRPQPQPGTQVDQPVVPPADQQSAVVPSASGKDGGLVLGRRLSWHPRRPRSGGVGEALRLPAWGGGG